MDVSGSMRATDVQPNRLVASQNAAKAFLAELPRHVKVGIVAFAGSAQVVQPVTLSREDLVAAIDKFQLQRATAIGSAIGSGCGTLGTGFAFDRCCHGGNFFDLGGDHGDNHELGVTDDGHTCGHLQVAKTHHGVHGEVGDVDDDFVRNVCRSSAHLNRVDDWINETTLGEYSLGGSFDVQRHLQCDEFGEADLQEVDVTHNAFHWVALHFFDDGWVGVVANLQIQHGVESSGARQCNAQCFAVNSDGCWCHAVSVDDSRNLILGEQAAGSSATERTPEAGF
jgi:hypothetical protein